MAAGKKQDHKAILASLAPSVKRIYVKTKKGKNVWRKIRPTSKVAYDDEIIFRLKKPITSSKIAGRPAKAKPINEDVAVQIARRKDKISRDPLVRIAKKDPKSPEIMKMIITSYAKEAASLDYERELAESEGISTAKFTQMRTRILKQLSEAWLKNKEIDIKDVKRGGSIDLEGSQFQVVIGFLIETIKNVLDDSGMTEEIKMMLFNNIGRRIASQDWKAQVEAMLRRDRETG